MNNFSEQPIFTEGTINQSLIQLMNENQVKLTN